MRNNLAIRAKCLACLTSLPHHNWVRCTQYEAPRFVISSIPHLQQTQMKPKHRLCGPFSTNLDDSSELSVSEMDFLLALRTMNFTKNTFSCFSNSPKRYSRRIRATVSM